MKNLKTISKLPDVGHSIFTVMSKMARDYNAINLAQGFPGFDCSAELVSLVNKYMKAGVNQYAPMQGVLALRERLAEKSELLHGHAYHPETEITITSGATQAIYNAISAFVHPQDEVIVFTPAYDCYLPIIKINRGVPVIVPMKPPDYTIDWDAVKEKISSKTKMIIVNNPHNPTGTVLSENDLNELEKITKNTNIIILSDEVYEHIVFDKQRHLSIAGRAGLAERALVVGSFGKTFHCTGWKTGYCTAPEYLTQEFRKIHQFLVFSANNPIQHALAEFMKNKDNYLSVSNFYEKKRDYFLELIKNSRFKFTPAKGAYFQLLDYSNISDEKDIDYAERLTKEKGIASIPISVFYKNPLHKNRLRFCFAKENETLEKAAEILNVI